MRLRLSFKCNAVFHLSSSKLVYQQPTVNYSKLSVPEGYDLLAYGASSLGRQLQTFRDILTREYDGNMLSSSGSEADCPVTRCHVPE